MRLTAYEKDVRREIEKWQRGDASVIAQALSFVMKPVDWVVEQTVPDEMVEQAGEAVEQFLAVLNDASKWTVDTGDLLAAAKHKGLDVETVEDLRDESLETLDEIAQGFFTENTVLAALGGGGTGLGGAVLIAADIPILFAINFRLIQQIAGAYGFPMSSPEYQPIVLSIYNAAASGEREARNAALREVSVAAAAFANDITYKGRVRGTFNDQSRHIPREIAKNIVGRKLAQIIPLAGAAIGAGINYWFTNETAQTAYMFFRALYLEHKERL